MISYLKGTVQIKKERYVVVVIQDQIGYRVYATTQLLERLNAGDEAAFFIYTHVREDAIELYGFTDHDELDFFEKLIGISGVGPRSALGVLSVAPLADIKKAVIHGDPALLQKVTSIGKKTAERIIVELKEKIAVGATDDSSAVSLTENIQLIEALTTLGYRDGDIRKALRHIPPETKDLSDKIKEALKILSKGSV